MIPERESGIEHLLRELAPQVLGAITRRHRDFAMAEDAVQEALIAAAQKWPTGGIPGNPMGWLYHVALRRITDQIRSETARRRREKTVVLAEWAFVPPPDEVVDTDEDDTLSLLFMCCHPALTTPSAIALTLRAIGGLTTAEIARAFLVPEATMAQRISRAKQRIVESGISFSMPSEKERAERITAVLHVLYLIFNEGYTATTGAELNRIDLTEEAIRLARLTHNMLPEDGEVSGLLALMLLTDARRPARTGLSGELIPIDEQNRTLWNRDLIEEGSRLVQQALSHPPIGIYALQAAIAAIHDEASSAEETDWPQILAFYDLLLRTSDSPVIKLNHAVATAMVHGPLAGLERLNELDSDTRMTGYYRLDAVRAHLHEKLGDLDQAVLHYRRAAQRTTSVRERVYLMTRAARLNHPDQK